MSKLLRDELIGLECEVIKAANKSAVGIKGIIEDETLKTLVIDGKTVFKKESLFIIKSGGKKWEVEGDSLLSRPEDRIKKKIVKW